MPFESNFTSYEQAPWLGGLKSLAEAAQGLRKSKYRPYGRYTPGTGPVGPNGEEPEPVFHPIDRFEPYANPQIDRANELGRIEGVGRPYLEQAAQMNQEGANAQFDPNSVEQYLSPYRQQVLNQIMETQRREFAEHQLPQLQHEYARNGTYGGSTYQQSLNDLNRTFQKGQRDAMVQYEDVHYTPAMANALKEHETRAARKIEAGENQSRLHPLALAGHLADVTSLREQGNEQRGYEQMKKDYDYDEFMRQRNYPHEALAQESAIVHGLPHQPMSSYKAGVTQGQAQPNAVSSLGSLAGGLLGAGLMGGYGRKAGGPIRRAAGGLSRLPLMEGTMARKPKVGGSLGIRHAVNRDKLSNGNSGGYLR